MAGNKLELSFSSTETFKTCNRKYYYNYVLKLSRKFWPWLIFGNFVHLVFEKFYKYVLYFSKRNLPYDKKQLIKRAYISAVKKQHRLSLNTDLPAITDKQKEDCKDIIREYLKRPNLDEAKVLFVEKSFYIDIDDTLAVKGYIDRIDKINENLYHIVDYKTSKKSYHIDKNNQLSLYAAALKQILGKKDLKIIRILDFIKIEKTSSGEYDHSKEGAMFLEIKEIADKIRQLKLNGSDEDWKATPNDFCWCCDFKNSCDRDVAQNYKLLDIRSEG